MDGKNQVLGGGGIHHISLTVDNFDETVDFYTGVLGFTKTILFTVNGCRAIMMDTGNGSYLEVFECDQKIVASEGILRHVALNAADIDDVLKRVRAAGMEVTVEPREVIFPGTPDIPVRIAFFIGPGKEQVELLQYLKDPSKIIRI